MTLCARPYFIFKNVVGYFKRIFSYSKHTSMIHTNKANEIAWKILIINRFLKESSKKGQKSTLISNKLKKSQRKITFI